MSILLESSPRTRCSGPLPQAGALAEDGEDGGHAAALAGCQAGDPHGDLDALLVHDRSLSFPGPRHQVPPARLPQACGLVGGPCHSMARCRSEVGWAQGWYVCGTLAQPGPGLGREQGRGQRSTSAGNRWAPHFQAPSPPRREFARCWDLGAGPRSAQAATWGVSGEYCSLPPPVDGVHTEKAYYTLKEHNGPSLMSDPRDHQHNYEHTPLPGCPGPHPPGPAQRSHGDLRLGLPSPLQRGLAHPPAPAPPGAQRPALQWGHVARAPPCGGRLACHLCLKPWLFCSIFFLW